jgi:type VI protein secretion system component VasK
MQKKVLKIQLALFDDINAQMDKALNLGDVQSPLLKIEDSLKKSIQQYEMTEKLIADGIAKAKELGATAFVNTLNKKLSETKGGKSTAQNVLKNVSAAISNI